ncbi:MAG: SpvB/TcaC N-terminal domain-containing protein, partial [Gammaproteobacteria bacterium]|nr:SpvB/TcaC N-terminal domain-containing protein [Gammaproteobacteria bacterium]
MKTTYRWKVGRLLIAAGLTALFFASMANGAPTAYKATLVGLLDATVATPVDSDADGFSNGADPDDDNDGLTDVYETSVGLDPFDSSDAAMDSDHDGASNLDEFLASSDPFDFLSCSGATCAFEPAPQRNQISIPPVDTYSDQVGAIAASMGVNAVGNLTYSIPLFSFTGTAGLQPNLTLSYNSGDGNGLVGVGWSISGTSIINRCPRTKAQDGVNSNVTLDQADRFCIDGQRLVLADPSQSYGGNLVEYRTEIDSNRKVVSYGGTLTDGPEFFRVWDEDGSVSVYGNTENSRVYAKSAVSKPIIWARSEKYDAHSFATNSANKIAYQYYNPKYMGDADYGNIRLLAIGYAASEPGS